MGCNCANHAILKNKIRFSFLIPNLIFYALLFILRNFCHRPNENWMFLEFLWSKTNFTLLSFFFYLKKFFNRFDVSEVGRKLMVLILVDMDSGDQDLHIAPGGHLYFRLDIILVKALSKHTLNTYFSGTKIDPNYAFLHAFFLVCPSCPFENWSI